MSPTNMSPLWITRRLGVRPLQAFTRLLALTALGLIGCGTATPPVEEPVAAAPASTPGMNDPSWLTSREKLPPPDTDRIEYDSQKRTLTLYDLPGRDNWMVKLPDEAVGRLVGAHHRLPEGIDTTQILVYYARAGVKISAPVTVAQIEAVRKPHTSLDRMAFRD